MQYIYTNTLLISIILHFIYIYTYIYALYSMFKLHIYLLKIFALMDIENPISGPALVNMTIVFLSCICYSRFNSKNMITYSGHYSNLNM